MTRHTSRITLLKLDDSVPTGTMLISIKGIDIPP
jgi:hypothetical protein